MHLLVEILFDIDSKVSVNSSKVVVLSRKGFRCYEFISEYSQTNEHLNFRTFVYALQTTQPACYLDMWASICTKSIIGEALV